MNTDRISELRKEWEAEEKVAHIHGWDFSHIHGRYEEEDDLPWDYKKIIDEYLLPDMKLMDFDTGGGEFLLSLNHPYKNTAATEGYAPNVELCKETLSPLGIDFRSCDDESNIPFADSSFDIMINRHGSFDPVEAHRLLKTGGLFITQQVGGRNDRDLVEMVLPDVPAPFPELELSIQRRKFEEAGFEIIRAEEVFKPIRFYDVGAFVWFAHIIEWEFPGFSVEKCFDKLLEMQGVIDRDGFVEGTIHRYLIVAKKKSISIKKLNYGDFVGQNYEAVIHSDRYLDITPEGEGFSFAWKTIEPELSKTLKDEMLSDWLDNPVAYGAYEGDNIIGFVEGFLEKWNNRFRISNICVFDSDRRQSGVGTKLLEVILKEAVNSKARMAVLETQSYNYKAISFYKKNGFEIIGFDRYAYSNADPENHNMRIEMGKRF